MRFLAIAVLVLLPCSSAHGQPSAKEVITKFRKVIGADGPALTAPVVIKYRGQQHLYSITGGKLEGQAIDYVTTLTILLDTPQQTHRSETEMKIGIVPLKYVEVADLESGWYQINLSDAVAMSKIQLDARRKRSIQVAIFLGMESFDPERWEFSEPKSTQVRGQEAWQVEAKTGGVEPITLSFAKQTGLLLHLKTKANDFDLLSGEKAKIETFARDLHFHDWKKFGNRMLPGHVAAFHDGVLWKHLEPVSVSFPKTIDAKLFAMPKAKQ